MKNNFIKIATTSIIPMIDKGFVISEINDVGMFKNVNIENDIFFISFYYEKGPIHCSIIHRADKKFVYDIIHLCNYLNDKHLVYDQPNYYLEKSYNEIKDMNLYFNYYLEMILKNFESIIEYMKNLDMTEWNNFKNYYTSENMKHWKDNEKKK